MRKIVIKPTVENIPYLEGIILVVRKYMREDMPEEGGKNNTLQYDLLVDEEVGTLLIVQIYYTKTSIVVHAHIHVEDEQEDK